MKKRFLLFTGVLIAIVLVNSCKHEPAEMPEPGNGNGNGNETCDTVQVTYKYSVLPIFDQYCLSCHSGSTPQAGINLEDYSTVAALAKNGTLLGSIRHEAGFSPMPQGGDKLGDCDISKIEIWIRDTTFTEPEPPECDTVNVTYPGTIQPLLAQFCLDCHSGPTPEGGLDFENFDILASVAQSGHLLGAIRHEAGYSSMPPSGIKLSDCDISKFEIWIRDTTFTEPPPPECDTVNVTYPGTIQPLLAQFCLDCHSGPTPEGGLDFEDFETLAFVAQSGQLLGAIRHEAGYSSMPPSGINLSDCDIAKFEIWIRDTTFTEPGPGGIPCDPDTVYFQNTILPLLQSSCGIIGCHDPGTAPDDIVLTSYQSIMEANIIDAGDPFESELYEVLIETDPDDRMPPPPRSPLTSAQITSVFKWIEQGALNNHCDEIECDTVNVSFAETVWPVIQGSCFGCHSGPSPQGGILLENYDDIVTAANNGLLLGTIKHEPGYSPMPQNGAQLSDCKISQIENWINDGTPNN